VKITDSPCTPPLEKLSITEPPIPWFKDQQQRKKFPEDWEDDLSDEFDTSIYLAQDECSDDESSASVQKEDVQKMEKCQVTHWKHVIYNLLVDNHNDPQDHFCYPYVIRGLNEKHEIEERFGFRFDIKYDPAKKLAELWAGHEKNKSLEDTILPTTFKQDLYKYYLRAALDLLAKYFIKHDRFTFLYDGVPLFVPNGSLDEALTRIKSISARNRKTNKPTKSKATTIKKGSKSKKRVAHESFISKNSLNL